MSYTALADLQKRISDAKLIQLTDYADTGKQDDPRITEALNLAAGIIDSYARGRYVLPLTVSAQVRDLELSIAIFKLHEGRQIMTDPVRSGYEDAISFLRDVAAGKASLDQDGKAQSSELDIVTRDHDDDPEAFDDVRLSDWMG